MLPFPSFPLNLEHWGPMLKSHKGRDQNVSFIIDKVREYNIDE